MNTSYKVSVVTPFHDIDMLMFAKCADSMRAQTPASIKFSIV